MARHNVWIPDELWQRAEELARRLSYEMGDQVSVSELIRRGLEHQLEVVDRELEAGASHGEAAALWTSLMRRSVERAVPPLLPPARTGQYDTELIRLLRASLAAEEKRQASRKRMIFVDKRPGLYPRQDPDAPPETQTGPDRPDPPDPPDAPYDWYAPLQPRPPHLSGQEEKDLSAEEG